MSCPSLEEEDIPTFTADAGPAGQFCIGFFVELDCSCHALSSAESHSQDTNVTTQGVRTIFPISSNI